MIRRKNWNVKKNTTDAPFKDRVLSVKGEIKESPIHDYIDMIDIDIAVFEITEAMRRKQRIGIFGDYDVDGSFATTILRKAFADFGYPVSYHIPERLTEGYGISDAAADKIIEEHAQDLIITVDNGIAAASQIERIQAAGIKVVVTDHHEPKTDGDIEFIPKNCPVIDNKRKDSTYPFRDICGAVVALKLAWAIGDELGMPDGFWKKYLPYAAIATVADVMPLIDENRTIVKEGIKMLKTTKDVGLMNILRVAGKLDNIDKLSSDDIAFYIAPLINASSRIGDINVAMELMMTEDPNYAIELADQLKDYNDERKNIEAAIFREANISLVEGFDFKSVSPVVVCGDNWHKGVIGIVASRLVETYKRPAIVLSNEDGMCHGSCRTYGDIDIIELLKSADSLMSSYGGHKQAAGLKLKKSLLNDFRAALEAYAASHYRLDMFEDRVDADMVILPQEVTLDNIEMINNMAPFGQGNREPVFVMENVEASVIKRIGNKEGHEGAHLKMTIRDGELGQQVFIDGVGFNLGDFNTLLAEGDRFDVMFRLSVNEWKGKKTPQIMINDIRCSVYQQDGLGTDEDALFTEDGLSIGELVEEYGKKYDDYIPTKSECFAGYKVLCMLIAKQLNGVLLSDIDILSLVVSDILKKVYINPFKLARIIEINVEAGYFFYKRMGSRIFLALTNAQNTCRIEETETFKRLLNERQKGNENV